MARFPFPQGQLAESQHSKDGTIKLKCTSFVAENIGTVPVTILGRTIQPGENFNVPFNGVVIVQDLRIKFANTAGEKMLYILQTTSQECDS